MRSYIRRIVAAVEGNSRRAYERFMLVRQHGRHSARVFLHRQRLAEDAETHTFANGVSTALVSAAAENWHMRHARPVVVVLVGEPAVGIEEWLWEVHASLRAHILMSTVQGEASHGRRDGIATVLDAIRGSSDTDLAAVRSWIQQYWRRCDVVFIDTANPLPAVRDIIRLQHAGVKYYRNGEIGFVQPALRLGDRVIAGPEFDRLTQRWATTESAVDYGQNAIPRYSLGARTHGFYILSECFDRLDLPTVDLAGVGLEEQLNILVERGWRQNWRTLTFSPVVLEVERLVSLEVSASQRDWLLARRVEGADGRRRIIFVLNATTTSGGIRVVFEEAHGLVERGFAVEIWSLEGQPAWFDLRLEVRTFRTYDDLLLALRGEDAIKVATWWETAEIVWLASVNHGIPVNFVQEFETWFYPDQPDGRAAVAASYRREHVTLTTASYQRSELDELGVSARLIPVGYEPGTFHPEPGMERRADQVLAIGRSFFQKNLAMTLRAWERLRNDSDARMTLFGSEPDIAVGIDVEYVVRPTDVEVRKLYSSATCFVQTSIHEGFSLPLLEAMACGCPVITTDAHGNRDFCIDEVNCLIVDQDDSDGLARAISRLLGDEELRRKFSESGLETARRYAWPVVLDELEDFYSSVE
ncbi:glycosyltransferase family 4 protein [Agromyces humi]|uniref:glycosyltransferase family 4 protein n=1 Tax=Agromyces humi TaxID=1766800 RepID=UPI0013598EA7|nr:glycosyltransferase family 4 protein [Agromyces humi]